MYQKELKEILINKVKEKGVSDIICDFIGYYECFGCNEKNIYNNEMECCKHCLFYTTVKSDFNRKCNYLCAKCYDINKEAVDSGNKININITFLEDGGILCTNCYINCLSCHTCFYDLSNDKHFKCHTCNGVFCDHCSEQTQIYSRTLCDFCYNHELENYYGEANSD